MKGRRWLGPIVIGSVLAVGVAAGALLFGGDDDATTPIREPTSSATPTASPINYTGLACFDIRAVATAVGQGSIGIADLPEKFAFVNESAQQSDNPAIRDAAARALAASDPYDDAAMVDALNDFREACEAEGF
jgi:hypothetical protein